MTGLLANSVEPVKQGAGYAAFAYFPIIMKHFDMVTVFLGVHVNIWLMAALTLLAAIIVGTVF